MIGGGIGAGVGAGAGAGTNVTEFGSGLGAAKYTSRGGSEGENR